VSLKISASTLTSALGRGLDSHRQALLDERSGLRPSDFKGAAMTTWIGRVDGIEDLDFPLELAEWDCRNNRLAWLAMQQDGFSDAVERAIAKFGAKRVAIFVGTSTSGIAATEESYQQASSDFIQLGDDYQYAKTQNVASLARFVSVATGANGHHWVTSTACSSSAKVFATASRALKAGLCDAAIVGGVDTLCRTTLHGFHALQLVSETPCRPGDARRDGISIGEAGGFALVTLDDKDAKYAIYGYGESSDAHHMSSPEPNGRGARDAMRAALDSAGLFAHQVDYVNLHGTATPANDLAESKAVVDVFGQVPCSSTKAWTGHTLGAAGIIEALIATQVIESGVIPPNLNLDNPDDGIGANFITQAINKKPRYVLSNSFGFGGNNCALIVGEAK
jgi:3-oxoacyl-[acyl-carrier-protein] synthase-1